MANKTIFGIAAAAALIATPALAADMPVKAPPHAPAPSATTWTGCYIGGNVGGLWSRLDSTWVSISDPNVGSVPINPPEPRGTVESSGAAYGAQIGCDYQFNSNWVVGIRGMWDGSTANGQRDIPGSQAVPNIGNFPSGQADHVRIVGFETVTGRIGSVVSPTVMLYGLGGGAWLQERFTVTQVGVGDLGAGRSSWTGYDVGGGVSWLLAPNWELWLEYDHMGFGSRTNTLLGRNLVPGTILGFAQKLSMDEVLVGLNWRFNGPIGAR